MTFSLWVTIAGWLSGWILLGRMRACAVAAVAGRGGSAPRSRAAAGGDRGYNTTPPRIIRTDEISIIIPARDEEQNLGALLRSIVEQEIQPHEIIVVDDLSTDGTAGIAHQHGARLIRGAPPPDGWCGKTWACHQGAQAATGALLLFLDADTSLESNGLSRLAAEFESANDGALSIAPYHVVPTVREQFSAFFNLVTLASIGAFTILGDRMSPRGFFGQCLLITREAYQQAGGYGAVKDRILENFSLGEILRTERLPSRARTGQGTVTMRMYPQGWRELIDGWSKGFAFGAAQTQPLLFLLIVVWLTGLVTGVVRLVFTEPRELWIVIYAFNAMQLAWFFGRFGAFRLVTALFYPLPLFFFFIVFARSIMRTRNRAGVLWKGRLTGAN